MIITRFEKTAKTEPPPNIPCMHAVKKTLRCIDALIATLLWYMFWKQNKQISANY